MADISVHQSLIGSVYDTDEVELQRSDTEVSMKTSSGGVSGCVFAVNCNDDVSGAVIVDNSENSNNGVLSTNTENVSVIGKIHKAFRLNTTRYGIFNHISAYENQSFSIELWYKPDVLTGARQIVSKFLTNGDQREWFVGTASNSKKIQFATYVDGTLGGANYIETISEVLDENNLVHIVCTYATGVAKIYINKVSVPFSGTPATSLFNGNANIQINGINNGAVNPSDGTWDIIRVYDKALTQEEVNIRYNNGLGTEVVDIAFPTETEITLTQNYSGIEDSQWKFSQITDLLENPNGEAGTVKYKYAVSNTTIPTYQDTPSSYNATWLTLAELKEIAETLTVGQYCRFAIQLSGDGSQDATSTNFGVGVEIACPMVDYPEVYEVASGVSYADGTLVGTRTDANPNLVLTSNGSYGNPSAPFVPVWQKADSALYKDGETFGVDGTSETGSYDVLINDPDDLILGVLNGEGVPGTVHLTTPNNLRDQVGIGANATEVVGNIVLTDEGNVTEGVGIGAEGTEIVGTRTDANPDLVVLENGAFGDPDNPLTPNWTKADKVNYVEGETFGIGGTSEVGEFSSEIVEIVLGDNKNLSSPCKANKIYVDTIGLNLVWSVGLDITNATAATILVKRPDGSFAEWATTSAIYEEDLNRLIYTTIEDDLSLCGIYEFQPKIVINDDTLFGIKSSLTVHKRYT